MKATIESTGRLVEVNGHWARVWEGKTEGGVDILLLVCQVASPNDQPQSEMEEALQEHKDPSIHAVRAFPLKMVL